jgi:hypothetical protein
MQKNPIKKKTAAELKKEAALRKKNAKKSGHSARSKAAKKGAKSMSKSERIKRALKSWKTRRKLYGDTGTVTAGVPGGGPKKTSIKDKLKIKHKLSKIHQNNEEDNDKPEKRAGHGMKMKSPTSHKISHPKTSTPHKGAKHG